MAQTMQEKQHVGREVALRYLLARRTNALQPSMALLEKVRPDREQDPEEVSSSPHSPAPAPASAQGHRSSLPAAGTSTSYRHGSSGRQVRISPSEP
jgi:hypothetical protein